MIEALRVARKKIEIEEARVFDFHGLGIALTETSKPSDLHVLIVEGALRIMDAHGASYLADRLSDHLRPAFAAARFAWDCGPTELSANSRSASARMGGGALEAAPFVLSRGARDRMWRPFSFLERRALRGARCVWCVSDFTRRQLLSNIQLPEERTAVLPNALDPHLDPSPFPQAEGPPVILSISRISVADGYKESVTLSKRCRP